MPEAADEGKPVSAAQAQNNVYTVLLVLASAVIVAAIVVVLMELQDEKSFGLVQKALIWFGPKGG
jgi:hypothetical protein